MLLRVMGLSLALVVAACASRDARPKAADGLETAGTEAETIHVIDPDAAEASPAREPRRSEPAQRPLVGNDPRGDAGENRVRAIEERLKITSEGASRKKTVESPGLAPVQDPNVPMAPMAGRVGVMSLLGNELKHVHSSTFGGHEQSYNVQYDFNGFVMEELRKSLLTKTPYQPVPVASTGLLRKHATHWQQTWNGKSFAPEYQREFDGIIKQNRLAMLIVVDYSPIGGGILGGRKFSGAGLYTRSGLGSTQAGVFCTIQFYRLVGEPAKLVLPIAPDDDRNIGDLPNAHLPDDLDDLPARALLPVYEPLRIMVRNKVAGLVSLPRKLGH